MFTIRREASFQHHVLMEGSGQGTVIGKAVNTALIPIHAAVSKPAQKAYLSTFLFLTTSLFLFGISSIAYTFFYYNYVPQIGVDRIIHLQFGDGNPHGTASFSSVLTSLQAYDISLFLHLPRTRNNVAAGNFMLDLSLLSPNTASNPSTPSISNPGQVLARSRRPAILTYASPIIDTASTISGLPWYIMGWKKESEILKVDMFESVAFAKGWRNIPQSVKVVIEADEKMQFYEVVIKIVARFGGLRWILYHHRIFSFLFFTSAFWTSSMIFALIAWLFFSSYSSIKPDSDNVIKSESDSELDPFSTEDFSDTSRSFPTMGRQMPLHFTRREYEASIKEDRIKPEASIKQERDAEEVGFIQPLVAEADDEDDDMETAAWRDSGIGTSLDDADRNSLYRRRNLYGSGKG